MAHNDHAVIVGIRTYPAIRPLKGPCWDAGEFAKWLVGRDKGAVPKDNIKCLTTEDFDDPENTNHPNASEVHELFKEFVNRGVMGGDPIGRRLYIYMAGHGFSERSDMTSAALYGAEADPPFAPNIAGTAYARWFRYNAVFDEIVLVMDCCRTTSPTIKITPPPLPETNGSPRRTDVRTFHAYAVPDGQPAREKQVNGKWRGIFTSALLDGLERAVPNESGEIRGKQVADYVHQAVRDTQPPEIEVNDRRDVVFSVNRSPELVAAAIRLEPFQPGLTAVILRDRDQEVARDTPNDAVFEVMLPAGFYKAVVEGTDRQILFEVPSETETVV